MLGTLPKWLTRGQELKSGAAGRAPAKRVERKSLVHVFWV
jgi:hypothetical protein